MMHDSNLLRLDGAATGINTADTIRQYGAGMNVDWKVARQQFLLSAVVNDNRFDRYSMLNYQGRDLRGTWNWQLDGHLSGDMGYSNSRTLGSFADQQTLVSNLRIQERSFFDGLWSFYPGWQVGAGVSRNRLTFPDPTQRFSNRRDDAWETLLQYVSSANNKVGVKLRETTGYYADQLVDFVNLLDNGYRQRELYATLDWNDGGHNLFQGQAGRVQRIHDHFSSRDYNDINARGTYSWLATGHLRLNATVWREIWAYDDLTTSYSRNRGVGLEPKWTPWPTITVSAKVSRERRDFLGNPGIFMLAVARQDTVLAHDLTLTYQPALGYRFEASVSDDKRDSNLSLFSYYSKMASVSANIAF